jgi:hypothetical protein
MDFVIGDFIDAIPQDHDSLELIFTPTSKLINDRWKNNRLSAHFLADYFVNFLPIGNSDITTYERRIRESRSAVSYVGNELLENAMKFHDPSNCKKVKLGMHFIENPDPVAAIFATNSTTVTIANRMRDFIAVLERSDPEKLYIQQVERSSVLENNGASGLGILTMLNDYSAAMGWTFETMPDDASTVTLTTMAQISI